MASIPTTQKKTGTLSFGSWVPVTISVMAGVFGAILMYMITPSAKVQFSLFAFLLISGSLILTFSLLASLYSSLLASNNRQADYVDYRVFQAEEEFRSIMSLHPLLGNSFLSFNGGAIEGRTAERLIRLLEELLWHPASNGIVLECGSGTSTVLIAKYLKQQGKGTLISLEHDEFYANKVRAILQREMLEDRAIVIDTPLISRTVNNETLKWYDFKPEAYLEGKIDLLFVDGPPGSSSPLSRYPAILYLKEWIRPGGIILLDDAHREDEKKIAKKWGEELGIIPQLYRNGKGTFLFRTKVK